MTNRARGFSAREITVLIPLASFRLISFRYALCRLPSFFLLSTLADTILLSTMRHAVALNWKTMDFIRHVASELSEWRTSCLARYKRRFRKEYFLLFAVKKMSKHSDTNVFDFLRLKCLIENSIKFVFIIKVFCRRFFSSVWIFGHWEKKYLHNWLGMRTKYLNILKKSESVSVKKKTLKAKLPYSDTLYIRTLSEFL